MRKNTGSETTARSVFPDRARGEKETARLDAIDAERRTLRTGRKWRTIVNAVMTERGTHSHRQRVQDIRVGKRKAVAQILFWHLGTGSRDKKDMCADADMMLVRAITRATPVVRLLRITMRVVIAVEQTVVVVVTMPVIVVTMRMSVFVSVNTRLSGIGRMVVATRVRRRLGATAHEVLSNERDEHHQ